MPIDNAERERRLALLDAHCNAENNHDLGQIMETFANETEMLYHRQSFRDPARIAQAHSYIGFAGQGAFFADLYAIVGSEPRSKSAASQAKEPPGNAKHSFPAQDQLAHRGPRAFHTAPSGELQAHRPSC